MAHRSPTPGPRRDRLLAAAAWPCLIALLTTPRLAAQETGPPQVRAGRPDGEIRLDGRLDEAAWQQAGLIEDLTMVEPVEGAAPSLRTTVRVLADRDQLWFGIDCADPEPDGVVAFNVARDGSLGGEDHVRVILGTFLDGRSGYLFSVNPLGARFDALITDRGEGLNRNWDGIWEAAAHRHGGGWSVEIRIPVRTLAFDPALDRWHLNIQRRIQRKLETDRWAGASQNWNSIKTSQAGLLTGLPEFELGSGFSLRPAAVAQAAKPGPEEPREYDFEPSMDLRWKPQPDLELAMTLNTDFAETEVDTRRTNLTRFPLFFPEKRAFFLEGDDFFDFGFGLGRDVVPFHSRRIGLVGGEEVPLLAGMKATGRFGGTSLGALATQVGEQDGVAPETAMGVVRLKQDLFEESSVGMIATAGDPLGRNGAWMAGADFTYQTSSFGGERNFLAGAWLLGAGHEGDSGGDRSAMGAKLEYPNDLWELDFSWKRIGEDFDPSLGFVPRRGVHRYRVGAEYKPRPELDWLRQMYYQFGSVYTTDLNGRWESYIAWFEPLSWQLESGDEIEFGLNTSGDRPTERFEVADGVEVRPGTHRWDRYGFSLDSAGKRAVAVEASWWTGEFYTGRLHNYELSLELNPFPLLTVDLDLERNVGRLPAGAFTEDAYRARFTFNLSPDLVIASYLQYDDESDELGTNNRLRWTITPESELFFVITYNWHGVGAHMVPESYDTVLKLQYELRF